MFADTSNPDRPPDNTVQMPPIPNRAALYLGPAADEEALRRYADALGLEIVVAYRGAGGTGGAGDGSDGAAGNPVLARLIEDAQTDQFDAVVVASRADAAADPVGYDRLRDALTEVSVRLLVADESPA